MFWLCFITWILVVRAQSETNLLSDEPATSSALTNAITSLTDSTSATSSELTSTTKIVPSVRVIDELRSLAHGVSSGKIMIVGNDTFEIPDFHFDGTASTAYFLVGKGDKVSEKGTFLYPEGTTSPLPAYNGQTVKLTLPNNLSLSDIDWLSVWYVENQQNLGYVFVNKQVYPYPPQTFSFRNKVTSGPVVLVNKKTLFISNFHYDGSHEDVHFWVGNGTEPSSDGVVVPNEYGSYAPLRTYNGQNLYINLPSNVSTDNIEYFAVWSADEKVSLGYVPIKGIEGVPEAPIHKGRSIMGVSEDEKKMRLPKCCPENAVLTGNGCEEKPEVPLFQPTFNIYRHNATHFLNESMNVSSFEFAPYYSVPECEFGKYPLDNSTEEFALLLNSSLLVKGAVVSGVLPTDAFCLDFVEDENITEMKILVCVPDEVRVHKAMFYTYVTFTIVSTFCFAVTFFLYCFWLKVEDVHRRCFTGYALTMTITFLSLTIVQTANVENSGCEVLGFFFQIFMIASFTLLAILCVDIFIIIKYIDEQKFLELRKRCFLGVALGVPILFMIISLSRNLTPDVPNSFFKPQYLRNNCYFEAENQRTLIFYIPICLSMIVSAVFLSWTRYIIYLNDKEKKNDYFWLDKGIFYKFMFRQCFLTLVIMTISWISNVLMSFLDESSGIFKAAIIFEAVQGVLIVAVFTMNHYGLEYSRKRQIERQANIEMLPINQNARNGEAGGESI